MNFETIQANTRKIATFAIAVGTILYGLFSYLYLALQLFWDEYGEEIQIGTVRFLFFLLEVTGKVYMFGQESRRYFDSWLGRKLDSAFFQLVDIQ